MSLLMAFLHTTKAINIKYTVLFEIYLAHNNYGYNQYGNKSCKGAKADSTQEIIFYKFDITPERKI